MKLKLFRFSSGPMGTFGVLGIADPVAVANDLRLVGLTMWTVERPWVNNERNVSCVPPGVYELKPTFYHRGGYSTFELMAVPDRSRILIHRGNTMDDVQGCIAVGDDLGCVGGKWAVLASRDAFTRFMNIVPFSAEEAGGSHTLEIIDPVAGMLHEVVMP